MKIKPLKTSKKKLLKYISKLDMRLYVLENNQYTKTEIIEDRPFLNFEALAKCLELSLQVFNLYNESMKKDG